MLYFCSGLNVIDTFVRVFDDLCGLGFEPTPIEAEPKYLIIFKCVKAYEEFDFNPPRRVNLRGR